MPRAPKKCGRTGCETRVVGRTYCDPHKAEADARASSSARGYGRDHRTEREDWEPHVAAGCVACWRCGELIEIGEAWDLGHDDDDRTITRGPEHRRRCNRAAGGRRSAGNVRDSLTPSR